MPSRRSDSTRIDRLISSSRLMFRRRNMKVGGGRSDGKQKERKVVGRLEAVGWLWSANFSGRVDGK